MLTAFFLQKMPYSFSRTAFCTCFFVLFLAMTHFNSAAQTRDFSPQYTTTIPLNNGFYQVQKGNLWTLVDSTGKQLPTWDWYNAIGTVHSGRVLVRKGFKMGYTDATGRVVVEPKYFRATDFKKGVAEVYIGSTAEWIDTTGEAVNRPEEQGKEIETNAELMQRQLEKYGLRVVKKSQPKKTFDKGNIQLGKLPSLQVGEPANENIYGLADKQGTLVLSVDYQDISNFHGGIAFVVKDNKVGLIDSTGKLIVAPEFYRISFLKNGLAALHMFRYSGLADTKGIIMPADKYGSIQLVSDSLLKVSKGGKYGIIDLKGNEIMPVQSPDFGKFSEGMARISKNKGSSVGNQSLEKWGWVDISGKEVIAPQYQEGRDFTEGVAAFKEKKQGWGFIGKDGQIVLPPTFEDLYNLKDGIARAKKQGKWGWIDKTGKTVLEFVYDDALDFHEGLAPVSVKNKWGLMDKTGKLVVGYIYDSLSPTRLQDGSVGAGFEAKTEANREESFRINRKGEKIFDHRLD